MLPWEREIYITLLLQYLHEQEEKRKMLEKQQGITHG